MRRLADDEVVGNLLVLHDLHPDDVDTRVQRALEQVRPYLGSHAGGVSLSGRRRARRRAPAAGGQLRRLPVLGAHREDRDRGRDPGGRTRRGRRRGRGHGRDRADAAPDRAVRLARPRARPGRRLGAPGPRRAAAHDAGARRRRRPPGRREPRRHPGRLRRPLSRRAWRRCPRAGWTATGSPARAATPTTYAGPAARWTRRRHPSRRCRCCPTTAPGRCRCRGRSAHERSRLPAAHRGSEAGSRAGRRSAASSARSTSASGTGTSRTWPSTGCCASAGPATCCSPRRVPVAVATAGWARTCGGSTDLALSEAQWDALRIPVDLAFFFRQTGADAAARVLPRPRRRHRVAAGPGRLG